MILEFSGEAESDLENIADYIARDNPSRALSFIRELRSMCVELGEMPNAYPLVPRYEQYGIRRRVHGNYLIFYRIEGEQLTIIHILHGVSDYGAILFED